MSTATEEISGVERAALALVMAEVSRAGRKFGSQLDYSDDAWLAVLVEEVGEAAEMLNDRRLGKVPENMAAAALADEVIQVAAVAVRWLAVMGREPHR